MLDGFDKMSDRKWKFLDPLTDLDWWRLILLLLLFLLLTNEETGSTIPEEMITVTNRK